MTSFVSARAAGGLRRAPHRLTSFPASIPASSRLSFSTTRSLSTSFSSSLPPSIKPRSAALPILAVSATLLAAQQLHFHSSAHTSASPSPSTSPSTPSTPSPSTTPTSTPLPTFDLTVLPYFSKAAFLSQSTVKLYQYQTCPFCNKVRAYLDYARVPYEVIEVNPMTKTEIKAFKLKAVPVVTVDHLVLHESSAIITAFDDLFRHYAAKAALTHSSPSAPSLPPSPPARSPDEDKWRGWVDSHLIFLTAPNLYTSLPASLTAMDYIMSQTSLPLTQRLLSKYVGGPMMYLVSEYKLKKKRGITDARGQLFTACRQWGEQVVGEGGQYRGGKQPDLSDVAMFGVVRAMMGFPVGDEMMEATNTSPAFVGWYQHMQSAVGSSSAKNPSTSSVAADYKGVAL